MKPTLIALAVASLLFATVVLSFAFFRPAPKSGATTGPTESRERGGSSESRPTRGAGNVTEPPRRNGVVERARPNAPLRGGDEGSPTGSLPIPRGDASVIFELSDAAGKPCSNADVTLLRGRSAETIRCDASGASAFVGIAAGIYTFTVEGDGIPQLVSAKELSLAAGEERHVPLTIDAYALSISGRVLDRGGAPVAGIKVDARRQLFQPADGDLLRSDQESLESKSGPGGLYEIRGLDAADYVLRTEASGNYPSVTKVYRAGSRSADIVLEEARLLEVHGVVTTREGAGLEGVRVVPMGLTARQAETDANGRYQVDLEITEGQSVQIITANKDGYREGRVNVRMDEARGEDGLELNLVMDSLGARTTVSGTVTDGERNPVGGETVYLHSSSLNARYQTASDARGRFKLADVQVGSDYRLWMYPRQGFKDFQRMPVEVPEIGAELEIILESIESGNLRGVMVDSNGFPVPSFTLWLKSLKALGSSVAVTGNEAGRFEAENVPEGELLFETRSLPRLTIRGVQFSPPTRTEVKLVLDWGANAFSGAVTDERGAPVPGASVSLYWSQRFEAVQSSSFRSAVTDASGRFSFSELGPGEHKINVSSGAHSPGQAAYDVGSGAPEPAIRLQPKPSKEPR